MGLAVSGVNNSISTQQAVQAQPRPEVQAAEMPDIEIAEISPETIPEPEKLAKNGDGRCGLRCCLLCAWRLL